MFSEAVSGHDCVSVYFESHQTASPNTASPEQDENLSTRVYIYYTLTLLLRSDRWSWLCALHKETVEADE